MKSRYNSKKRNSLKYYKSINKNKNNIRSKSKRQKGGYGCNAVRTNKNPKKHLGGGYGCNAVRTNKNPKKHLGGGCGCKGSDIYGSGVYWPKNLPRPF